MAPLTALLTLIVITATFFFVSLRGFFLFLQHVSFFFFFDKWSLQITVIPPGLIVCCAGVSCVKLPLQTSLSDFLGSFGTKQMRHAVLLKSAWLWQRHDGQRKKKEQNASQRLLGYWRSLVPHKPGSGASACSSLGSIKAVKSVVWNLQAFFKPIRFKVPAVCRWC